MSDLVIMGRKGDTKVIWSKANEDEVAAAEQQFNTLTRKGFAAFAVKKTGDKGVQVKEFDADAERLILVPPMAGGR